MRIERDVAKKSSRSVARSYARRAPTAPSSPFVGVRARLRVANDASNALARAPRAKPFACALARGASLRIEYVHGRYPTRVHDGVVFTRRAHRRAQRPGEHDATHRSRVRTRPRWAFDRSRTTTTREIVALETSHTDAERVRVEHGCGAARARPRANDRARRC